MSNEIAKKDWTEEAAIAPVAADVLTQEVNPFVSFKVESPADQIKLYNAMNSPQYRVADMINKPISMVDAVLVPCQLVREETGEVYDAIRAIIIDADGNTFAATSTGIVSSLRNIYNVFHTLHFDEPLKVTVQQVTVKRGNTLTLKLG